MAEKTTFIKLDRNIIRWQYYQDANVMRVLLHLLLTANIGQKQFLGVTIERGQVATTYDSLALAVGLSRKQVLRAVKVLQESSTVAIIRRSKFLVISIKNYNHYQASGQSKVISEVPSNVLSKGNQKYYQKATTKESKESKERKENARTRETPSSSAALEAQTPWGLRGMTEAEYEAWRNQ